MKNKITTVANNLANRNSLHEDTSRQVSSNKKITTMIIDSIKGVKDEDIKKTGVDNLIPYNIGVKEFLLSKVPEHNVVKIKDRKSYIENTIMEPLLHSYHPKAKKFYGWLKKSKENIDWYVKNMDNIKLVTNGIEILGDVFENKDEPTRNGFTIEEFETYLKKTGKTIPEDWSKYTNFLPGDDQNKVNFLVNVLGLHENIGGYDIYYNKTVGLGYWSSKKINHNDVKGNYYISNMTSSRYSFFSPSRLGGKNDRLNLRCIKKSVNESENEQKSVIKLKKS